MSSLPNPAGLKYFDHSDAAPAPQGVQVPFNQDNSQFWLGYDSSTGQLCITNFNRTTTLVCFSGGTEFATFLVPLEYTQFIDAGAIQKAVAVGRLPEGYRYWGFIFRNDTLWVNDNGGGLEVVIIDTVSGAPIDAPVINAVGLNLVTMTPSQQVDGSVSVGLSVGITGNCFLDGDGRQGLTVQVQSPLPGFNLALSAGTASLYVVAIKTPANPPALPA